MKRIIIMAIVTLSSTIAFAQNNNTNDKYSYNKEGLDKQSIQVREDYIRQAQQAEQQQAQLASIPVTAAPASGIVSDPTDGVKTRPSAISKSQADPKNSPSFVKPKTVETQTKKEQNIQKTNSSSAGFINTK